MSERLRTDSISMDSRTHNLDLMSSQGNGLRISNGLRLGMPSPANVTRRVFARSSEGFCDIELLMHGALLALSAVHRSSVRRGDSEMSTYQRKDTVVVGFVRPGVGVVERVSIYYHINNFTR